MNTSKAATLTLCAGALAALVASLVWASLEKDVLEGFRILFRERWGIATLLDVYAGLLVASVVIAALERRPAVAGAWILASALLGNVATLTFLLLRLARARTVREALAPPP